MRDSWYRDGILVQNAAAMAVLLDGFGERGISRVCGVIFMPWSAGLTCKKVADATCIYVSR